MAITAFDFEKPLVELEQRLHEAEVREPRDEGTVAALREELERRQREVYSQLTPWQRVLVARHQDRPHSMDYIRAMTSDFVEVHGDRAFGDDHAVITGFAMFRGRRVAVIAQQKGRDTKENLLRNWGMMHPEGYRKALRVMQLAQKFGLPVVVFIDTPGAFPGIGAEERGQAEAIARNIRDMFLLETPVICVVVGEGASGGALGVGVGDTVLMLENSWYCVISPEGCAAILWKDRGQSEKAAAHLKLTPPDLMDLGVIDEIIPEPLGGAHRRPEVAYENVAEVLERWLREMEAVPVEELLERRYQKYRAMGRFVDMDNGEEEFADAEPGAGDGGSGGETTA